MLRPFAQRIGASLGTPASASTKHPLIYVGPCQVEWNMIYMIYEYHIPFNLTGPWLHFKSPTAGKEGTQNESGGGHVRTRDVGDAEPSALPTALVVRF